MCCWSVGNSLFAATSHLFDRESSEYIDPSLPRLQANFGEALDQDLDIKSVVSSHSADLSQHVVLQVPTYSFTCHSCPSVQIKKRFLFTFSGTSPPALS